MPVSSKQIFAAAAVALYYAATGAEADLRMASTPKNGFKTIDSAAIKFITAKSVYMEPSTFNYQGLANQKANNYDNFLRSNVDNEQDNRNFNTEAGKDMLPFRTLEAAEGGEALTMEVGKPHVIPLRWNNPHSSEIEVNVWIKDNTVVVPIHRPTCSGEGYQDVVVSATIPTDFNSLVSKVPGFNGCNKVGDCVLQIYAHSVEPRTYAIGVPLIVKGGQDIATLPKATDASQIKPATRDPGTDLSKLPRAICIPSASPFADIESAIPRYARLVSDVANHAFQNSDYSPYSGQQHERISRNLQAATILRMTATNGGELGKSILTAEQRSTLQTLRNKVNGIVTRYENAVVNIFNSVKNQLKPQQTVEDGQTFASCFRCRAVASVETKVIQQATYIPSLWLPNATVAAVRAKLNDNTKAIVKGNFVLIYETALNDMQADFKKAEALGIKYNGPVLKSTLTTMATPTDFKKVNAQGNRDSGRYAAAEFKKAAAAAAQIKALSFDAFSLASEDPADAAGNEDEDELDDIKPGQFITLSVGPELAGNPDDEHEKYVDADADDSDDGQSSSAGIVSPLVGLQAAVAAVFFYLKM